MLNIMHDKPSSMDAGNAAADSTTSSPSKALVSPSSTSVESPSSVTGVWNTNASSKAILRKLKEEKLLQKRDQTIVPPSSNDNNDAAAADVAAAAEEEDEAADSSSLTKYTHRTPLPVSASNSYSLPSMITVTTPSPPAKEGGKSKSPIFMQWEQMAAKNNNNTNNTTTSPILKTATDSSAKDEPTPSPTTQVNDTKSSMEAQQPRAAASVDDQEMQTTLMEVTSKISPPVEDIVDSKVEESNANSSLPTSSGISKRWPPSKQPPVAEEAVKVATTSAATTATSIDNKSSPLTVTMPSTTETVSKFNGTNTNESNVASTSSSSSLSPATTYTGKRWSPPKPSTVVEQQAKLTPTLVTTTTNNNEILNLKSTSSPSGIVKRWPPPPSSKSAVVEEQEEPKISTSPETTDETSPTPPPSMEEPSPPTVETTANANKKDGNVKSSSTPGNGNRWQPHSIKSSVQPPPTIPPPIGIGKRWQPPSSKSPSVIEKDENEDEQKIAASSVTNTTVETNANDNNKEGYVKKSSSSTSAITKRWPPSKVPVANDDDDDDDDNEPITSSLVATKTDLLPTLAIIGTSTEEKPSTNTNTTTTTTSSTVHNGTEITTNSPSGSSNASLPLATTTTAYSGKRWPKPNEGNNTTSTATAIAGSNKLKGRWPPTTTTTPTPQVDSSHDGEMAVVTTTTEKERQAGIREFRTMVTNLVCKVMPTEVDNVDELIEEYDGREAELLDILSSMQHQQVNGDCEVGVLVSNDNDNGQSICSSNMTEPASNTTKVTFGETSTVGHPFDEETAYAVVGNSAEEGEDGDDEPRSDKQARPKRCNKRTLIVVVITSCLFLAGVAIALGSTFGYDFIGNWFSGEQSTSFTSRDDSEMGIATGDFSSATQVPTPSPIDASLVTTLTACGSEEYTQELGLTSLAASYPKIAIDGDQAIVASGSGYVAFFALDTETKTWTRTALFGLMVNVGEITSVAIHGNTAVIGAPKATTDLSAYRDEPLETGAIFIYEKLDPTSSYSWEQKKGPYVPNEYTKGVTMDNYDDANFGASVDIYDDLIVASAPPESNNRGSVTVFKKDTESNDWVQLIRLLPPDSLTCGSKFFGYSVQINQDMIVASSDCDINLVLYRVDRSSGDYVQIVKFQEFGYVDAGYGAISSITIGENHLAYSTVRGGLITFQRESQDEKYVLSQELGFDFVSDPDPLYEYPLSSDESTMALSVAKKVLLYTRNVTSQEWMQESLILPSEGDFAGYTAASAALSNGVLMVADQFEVRAHDFMSCIIEASQVAVPVASPTVGESLTSSPTSTGCIPLDVFVTLDEHPSDTRWEIFAQGESTEEAIATSPVYDESMAFTQADTQTVCLPEGSYEFTIYDDYDGETTSDWFEVSFRLAFDDEEVGSGKSFGRNKTITFSTPNPDADECSVVFVNLKFDKYPLDESWNITQDGLVVASSPPFAEGATADVQELCLPDGDYVFTIYDAYGDGLCCGWGEGSYSVRTGDQDVIAEGAEFGPSESHAFTLPVSLR